MWLYDKLFGYKKRVTTKTEPAPYSSKIYQSLINRLKRTENIRICSFRDSLPDEAGTINVYFRHDIDTEACLNNLGSLLEIDKKSGIIPGIFFLVSDETYLLSSCKDLASKIHAEGYPVGLHSVCYLKDDYLLEFQKEIDFFTATLGFRPDTFNAHGVGSTKLENRLKFYDEISVKYKEFGFSYSDCCAKLRPYQHVIEDCHWDSSVSKRYIKADFEQPEAFIKPGNNLVLTHPCYWTLK
jgi:hypothetical protein